MTAPETGTTATGTTVLVAHPSAELYGSDRVMVDTVRALLAHGHRVVVTLPGDGPLTGLLRPLGVEVVHCPSPVLRKRLLRPRGALEFARDTARALRPARALLRDRGVDVVLVNTVTVPLWLVLARLGGRGRPTAVCHVHEAEASASPVVRRLLAAPLLLADRVVANSRFSRDVVARALPRLRDRVTVVPNAVPGPAEVAAARERPDGPARLVFVGRLSPRKGPQVAVAALERLTVRGVDATLSLVGAVFPGYEWFEQQLRRQVADAGLTDRVTLAGFDADVWPHLAAADIVLVPSTFDEPFGNTAVEAVLAARPAVVSATSGLLEAADGYGSVVFVRAEDADALAEGVAQVLADWPARREAAAHDAAAAARRHAPELYGDRLEQVLAGLPARTRR